MEQFAAAGHRRVTKNGSIVNTVVLDIAMFMCVFAMSLLTVLFRHDISMM